LCLRDVQDSSWSRTVAECLEPAVQTPAYLADEGRLVKMASRQWASHGNMGEIPGALGSPEQRADRDHEMARRRHKEVIKNTYAAQLDQRKTIEEAKMSSLEESRLRATQLDTSRAADLQLVVESRQAFDAGRRSILYEPPSRAEWLKPAPPHLTSHWDTIASHHNDPPPRKQERLITSYRRAFPAAEARPLTPQVPAWGGAY